MRAANNSGNTQYMCDKKKRKKRRNAPTNDLMFHTMRKDLKSCTISAKTMQWNAERR